MMIARTILRAACLYGAIQLAGCAWWAQMQKEGAENLRIQRVQVRSEEIFEKDLVHKFEFQHNCDEVSEAIVQHLIGIGFEIGTQSNTKVVTDKRYNRDYSGARVIMVVLHPAGAGCQMQGTQVDSWGGASESAPATKVELAVIEALEPERLQALHVEAKKRAEAENPPEAAVAKAPEGNEKANDVRGEKRAGPPTPEAKPQEQKAAAVATAGSEQGAGATEAQVRPIPRMQQPPVKSDTQQPPGPIAPPAQSENVITSAQPSPPSPAPVKGGTQSGKPWYFWSAATATALFTAGAIAAGLSASSKFNGLENSCGLTSPGCTDEQVDAVRSRATVANILWILAGASAVATGVTFFVGNREAGTSIALRF